MPIGVLGGTFDPVHCGHLRIAIEARETLGLAHVRLVPLNAPGHREPPFASVADRIAMLEAVAGDGLRLDRREIERGGTSYTVDTLESMRAEWPKRPLCLLMGLDSYLTLPAWHRADALLSLAHLVVAARPGVSDRALEGLDELTGNAQSDDVADLKASPAGRIFFLDVPPLPIASSDIRARRRAGHDVRFLVPDAVHAVIVERDLYRE